MQLLRDQAGLPLIERGEAGMVPTAAGAVLADTARRVEAVLTDGAARLAALAGADTGSVHVGVVSTAKYFAPRVLGAFARAHPGIEVRLFVGNRAEILQRLRDRDVDLTVMGRPPDEMQVVAPVIGPHPHLVIVPPDHALIGSRVAPALLARETFLVRERGSGTRTLMERFFADSGIAPRIGMEIGSNETVKQAVMAGLGIAFLSAHTVEHELQTGRLVALDVLGLPIVRQWHVVRLAERPLMPAAERLGQFFVEEGIRFLPRGPAQPGPAQPGPAAEAISAGPSVAQRAKKPGTSLAARGRLKS